MPKAKKQPEESPNVYTPKELRTIANAADVDPKTVVRYLNGYPLRPSTRARVVAAMCLGKTRMSEAGARSQTLLRGVCLETDKLVAEATHGAPYTGTPYEAISARLRQCDEYERERAYRKPQP